MTTGRKILKKAGRIFLWLFVLILSLVVVFLVFINLPVGKRMVRDQVQNYLHKKLKTNVRIGFVDYSLPEWLEIKNIYLEDQHRDTLLFGGEVRVDLHLLKLLQGNTDIEKILLHNISININRKEKDSVFNYQFLIDAFSGNNPSTTNKDTSELKLTMRHLVLDAVALNFKDLYAGNVFYAGIKKLDLKMDKFQPDRLQFHIQEIYANGVDYFMTTTKQQVISEPVAIDTVRQVSYPLIITAKKLDLRNVNVLLDNKVSGMYYANNVTHIASTNSLFNIGTTTGTTDDLFIDSTRIVFSSPKTSATEIKKDTIASSAGMPWFFGARNLRISYSDIRYDDNNKPATAGLDYAHLNVKNLNAFINGFRFSKDTTAGIIAQLAFSDTSGFKLDTTHLNLLFTDKKLQVKDLYIKTPNTILQRSIAISYDSLKAITITPQNSTVQVALTKSVIAFNDLFLLVPALKKSLGGFANQYLNVNTELRGNLQRLDLPYFQVSGLSGSRLDARGTLYNITDTNKFAFDLHILKSNFLKRDFIKFVPKENLASLQKLPDVFNLSGHFVGNKNDIVADFKTNAKDFAFAGKVNLKNISDPARLKYDATVSQLSLDKKLVEGFLPPAALESISLPQKMSAAGKLTGNTENINTDLRINSSYGALSVKGYVKNIKNSKAATYDLVLSTPGFAMGTLLKQDSVLGNIAGTFSAKGTGFDYKTMRSSILADIASVDYNKYHYKNTRINAKLDNGNIVSSGNINDPALKLNFDLTANVKGEYPTVEGLIRVDTAQLKQLNLYADTLNLSLTANIHSQNLQPRNLDASLLLDSIRVQSRSNFYRFDSVSITGSSSAGIDSIILKAPFAEVYAGGAFDYNKLGISLQRYVNNYYKIPGYQPSTVSIPDQQLGFNGTIKYKPFITDLVPGLAFYEDISFKGTYKSADTDSALNFNAAMPRIVYATNSIGNAAIDINSRNGKINYEVKFDTLKTSGNTLYATSIKGAAANDSISLSARTEDKARRDWFAISGTAAVSGKTYSFRMKDTLLLNHEKWKVAPDNYLSYSATGIIVNNVLLKNDTSSISIRSQQLVENSPIDINVNKFNLKSITSLINQDTLFVGGILDIKGNVSNLQNPVPGFTGTASITGLEFMQHSLGNLTVSADKESEDIISTKLALTGNGNEITGQGNYYINGTEKEFDAVIALNKLNLQTIEAISEGALRNTSGNITGEIKANGKFADPRWSGQLNFDTTMFTLSQLGAPYKIDKQQIVFEYPDIKFPAFTIRDSLNHPMTIDGAVSFVSKEDIRLNVDINTNDFVFVNARKAVNSEVYGYGAADVNVSVTGTGTKPKIEGDILLNNKSDLTIVLPEPGYEKNDGKTIVRFIDRDTFDINPPVIGFEAEKKPAVSFGQFLNYNLNIGVPKEASLSILLDPSTGDEIQVQGDANLNAGVDPGGNIVLAGTYELDRGFYELHYQFLERKFDLQKGSTITFAGPPLNANVNITAVYIATTSSSALLSNEVGDVSSGLANSFNQKIPFKVILKLSGQLSKPDITFDVALPEENNSAISADLRTTIENKLQQIRSDPASINKQVFSLLLFGRFIPEQSSDFFKGNGGDFSTLARQSVSQFLSSALNQIAGDIFKGIDIDLNLNSYNDYSNGGNAQRTDLNIAVSKNFANDRITVSVGQNFGIEGQDAAAKAAGSNTGFKPDIKVSYKLTRDGKYLLRAYTKNQFEVTVDGYVVETGLAFVLTMDYEKFNELFRRTKRKSK
ncbi:MAG: translocation/assembly module TamB domain-containing protein [Ferruginibacter sp.]|nr:translocation/assembly module TamB domain-containing protein [Ferruginibacter sp.]